METLEHLGISPAELAERLTVSCEEVERWLCGRVTREEADRFEVALSLLEIRLAKVVAAQ